MAILQSVAMTPVKAMMGARELFLCWGDRVDRTVSEEKTVCLPGDCQHRTWWCGRDSYREDDDVIDEGSFDLKMRGHGLTNFMMDLFAPLLASCVSTAGLISDWVRITAQQKTPPVCSAGQEGVFVSFSPSTGVLLRGQFGQDYG